MSERKLLLAITLPMLTGCGVLHRVKSNPPPSVPVPGAFARADGKSASGARKPDAKWWSAFSDPELNGLVDSAFAANLDLRGAYARLAGASAAARVAVSAYIPSLELSSDISNSRSVFNFGGGAAAPGGGGGGAFGVEQSQVNLQAALSYEVDLWGRVQGQAAAGEAELRASESDLATMFITVSANVVDAWLQVIEQRATLDLLRSQLQANSTYLELVELRFRQGLASSLDVLQQRQQAVSLEAQIPPVEAQLGILEHQLAVLLGRAPGTVTVARSSLPSVPPLPAVGLPADLLQNRPDVRAAQLRVMAADHRVGSAIANRFPRLTLSAAAGFQGFDVATGLFDNWFYNLLAGLTQPVTDQVRLEAEEREARARLEEQVAQYGQTVLTALREVEDALIQESRQDALLEELEEEVEVSQATLDEAQRRYRNGLSDYLPVLTALQSLQSSEQRRVAARRQRLSFRVQLHRALGGTWMRELETPSAEEEAS